MYIYHLTKYGIESLNCLPDKIRSRYCHRFRKTIGTLIGTASKSCYHRRQRHWVQNEKSLKRNRAQWLQCLRIRPTTTTTTRTKIVFRLRFNLHGMSLHFSMQMMTRYGKPPLRRHNDRMNVRATILVRWCLSTTILYRVTRIATRYLLLVNQHHCRYRDCGLPIQW